MLVRQHYVSWLVSLRHLVDEARRLGGCEALWVGGDFNQILDRTLDSWSKSPTVHVVPAGELQDLVWDWEAEDAFRFYQGDKKDYTFKPGGANVRNIFNRIDFIFVSRDLLEMFKDCVHVTVGMTDHRAVVMSPRESQVRKCKGLWRHNDLISSDPEFLAAVRKEVAEVHTHGLTSARSRWEFLKYKIREASRKVSMAQAKEKHARKKELLSLLDSNNPDSSPDMAEWQKELDVILLKEAEIVKIRSGVKYIEEGEK